METQENKMDFEGLKRGQEQYGSVQNAKMYGVYIPPYDTTTWFATREEAEAEAKKWRSRYVDTRIVERG